MAAIFRRNEVAFIDLHSLSIQYHHAIGPAASAWYNFDENDTTHFSPAGVEAITNLIAEELTMRVPGIASYFGELETIE